MASMYSEKKGEWVDLLAPHELEVKRQAYSIKIYAADMELLEELVTYGLWTLESGYITIWNEFDIKQGYKLDPRAETIVTTEAPSKDEQTILSITKDLEEEDEEDLEEEDEEDLEEEEDADDDAPADEVKV